MDGGGLEEVSKEETSELKAEGWLKVGRLG